jgi:hypothetical protein
MGSRSKCQDDFAKEIIKTYVVLCPNPIPILLMIHAHTTDEAIVELQPHHYLHRRHTIKTWKQREVS